MHATLLWIGLTLTMPSVIADDQGDESAADRITLRDNTVILGQVLGGSAFGGTTILVRRDWARANAGKWLRRWEFEEAPRVRRARLERKNRLIEWRKQRRGTGPAGDPVLPWIDREVAALSNPLPPPTPLIAVDLPRGDLRSIERQPEPISRLLRLGWLARLGGVETMSMIELRDALRFRGRLRADDPAWVDDLLPLYPESEKRWRMRRAVTEVAVEPALRQVQFRQFTLPEVGPERRADRPPSTTSELLDSPEALTAFQSIQAVRPANPLQELFDTAAARNRIGLIYSTLDLSVNADQVVAVSTLWVRQAGGRWMSVNSGRASVPIDAPPPQDEEEPVLDVTPIRTALLVLESVSAQPKSPEESRLRQVAGTVGQRALGRSRATLNREIGSFLLPVVFRGR